MKIVLGYQLDSGAYPDALGKHKARVGTVVTGFEGLIRILETKLGFVRPEVPEIRRIAAWEERIRTMGKDPSGQADDTDETDETVYSKSFRVDPWNTAKELLHRRDELVLAGWDPSIHQGGSPLLADLARLELRNQTRLFGFADRVRLVLSRLEEPAILNIEEILIVDEDESLWVPWCQQLIKALASQGVPIRSRLAQLELSGIDDTDADENTDLGRLKAAILHPQAADGVEAQGDGTLLLVTSETEWDAADYVATWLYAHGCEESLVLRESGSIVLDETLRQRGLPALGTTRPSMWRSVLQVLPLTLESYFEPLRLEPLLQLLTLPVSPIPATIGYRLAGALANAPGIGGPPWNEAISSGFERYEERLRDEGLDESEIKKRLGRVRERVAMFVDHETYSESQGLPLRVLLEVCTKVGQWAQNRQGAGEALYGVAAQHAEMVAQAAKALQVDCVDRLQVARLLNSVFGDGVHLPDFAQEASVWPVVSHPGQIFDSVDTIVWWGFSFRMSGGARVWSRDERAWLTAQGIHLADETLSARREATFWRRVVEMARHRLILVAPQKANGQDAMLHPLWDEICHAVATTPQAKNRIMLDASILRKEEKPDLGGFAAARERLQSRALPGPIRDWRAPTNVLKPRPKESATSFDSLLGCPLNWTLGYPAKISSGRALSLPSEPIMLGTLAHEVLRSLLEESKRWEPNRAELRARELFDELVKQYAAPLLEPQHGVLRQEMKSLLQTSVRQFFQTMNDAGIEILETEHVLAKNWQDGVDIEGRLDIVAQTRSKKPMVIDAKWSRNPKGYQRRLEGLSTQLTLYHWLLAENEDDELPVAYFMLRTGQFFAHPHPDLPADWYVDGPSLRESLGVLQGALAAHWDNLSRGDVIAAGISSGVEAGEGSPLVEPPCRFCEYKNLCGQSEVLMR